MDVRVADQWDTRAGARRPSRARTPTSRVVSILAPGAGAADPDLRADVPDCFGDLNLDQVVETAARALRAFRVAPSADEGIRDARQHRSVIVRRAVEGESDERDDGAP